MSEYSSSQRIRKNGHSKRSYARFNGPNTQPPPMFPPPFQQEMMPNNAFLQPSFNNNNGFRYPRPPNAYVEEQNGFDHMGEDCFTGDFSYPQPQNSTSGSNKKKKRKTIPYSLVQPTFDPYLTPECFQPVNNKAENDEEVIEAFNRKLIEIIPTPEDLSSISNYVNKVSIVLDKLKVSGTLDSCKIECVELVGSYRMNTMIAKHCCADIVVTLKSLPTKAVITNLGNQLVEELQKLDSQSQMKFISENEVLELTRIASKDIAHLHFATTRENLGRMSEDSHMKKTSIYKSLEATRHAQWFDEFIQPGSDVHNLIRVMKDVRNRFKDFRHLNPWMLITMCHYAMTYTANQVELPIWVAFRRIFQLFSAGSFLPYSSGINDPMGNKMPIHGRLAVQNQEEITSCAQTLLRVMNYKLGLNYILGLSPAPEISVLDMPSQWQGITVVPGTSVFTGKPQKKLTPN